ncbi:putative quinol monooxygenase [Sphingomonas daechungensis]|uniref:putative quinol monooxygenase n=1 Tax=Sphingomonas daechungensis TaxID=1176646 RepID=UPI001CB8C9FF|nr:antibiotic biosynthesis monooxygenase [Sphingomonas daechungensis]
MSEARSFIAKLVVKPERRDEFVNLQSELKGLVHAQEPDALVYELLQSDDDPNTFFCVATFKDQGRSITTWGSTSTIASFRRSSIASPRTWSSASTAP